MATEYKTGDTFPPIKGTVLDANNAAVNVFTATSLRFIAKRVGGNEVITGAATKIDDGTLGLRGRWQYTWGSSDLSVAGDYETEIEVTWSVGNIETFPDNKTRNPVFNVSADLD